MTDAAVLIKNISFSYDTKDIYKDFSLEIPKDRISFIMGVNGCGKTTLLKLICSFLSPDSGEIIIDGKNLREYDSKGLSRIVAYVPQIIHLNSDFLVKDYLALGRTPYKSFASSINQKDYYIVEKYAEKLEIDSLLDTDFNTLSGGQKQLVAICRALIQETEIIVMDEPMSALDLGRQADLLLLLLKLKAEGKTIVLTSHNPNHAYAMKNNCLVCLIHDSKIQGFGLCQDVLSQENIRLIYGEKVKVDSVSNSVVFDIHF